MLSISMELLRTQLHKQTLDEAVTSNFKPIFMHLRFFNMVVVIFHTARTRRTLLVLRLLKSIDIDVIQSECETFAVEKVYVVPTSRSARHAAMFTGLSVQTYVLR